MELKLKKEFANCNGKKCSNRTFMELKLYNNASFFDLLTVLIVPLWN